MKRHQLIKWSLAVAKLAVLGMLIWFVRSALVKAFDDLEHHEWHVAWSWLAAAACFNVLGMLPAADYWYRLLRACDQEIGPYAALRAYFVSQPGKYVPGKAIVLVLRAAMVRPLQVPTTLITATSILETLTNLADGALVALIIRAPQLLQDLKLLAAVVAMLLVTGLPILPPLFKLVMRYSGMVKLNPSAIKKLDGIGFRTVGLGCLTMAGGWWIQGLTLWAILRALGALDGGPLENWPLHTAVVALSMVAGFLAFLPGGIGAREFVIIELLKPVYGDTPAVVAAILLRFISVVSDALLSIILYLVRPTPAEPDDAIGTEPLKAGSNR
ncbi:MAG TPA: lysylphosphatidylglycerol synthase transmembrane domain-containing protein [Pirellulales bacterium]|jgi:hypothetical protein|nr:lysylphosphatidylglycerol synthase transmembrane domain-containing protein [Pirellulales bacterium]